MNMKKLLITGFDPFGGEKINPAWEAVKQLPDRVGEYDLCKLEIPTVFGEAARRVLEAAEGFRPDVVLCIGQAGGRAAVTPERIGVNIRDARIPDNEGNTPRGEFCVSEDLNSLVVEKLEITCQLQAGSVYFHRRNIRFLIVFGYIYLVQAEPFDYHGQRYGKFRHKSTAFDKMV